MEEKIKRKPLLPNYFKKTGLLVIALATVIYLFLEMFTDGDTIKDEIMTMSFQDLLILGLCFIILSRDKIEDERSISLRLFRFVQTFFCTVFIVIMKPIPKLIFGGIMTPDFNAHEIVLVMCFFYLVFHYAGKWDEKRKSNQKINSESEI